MMGQRGVLAAVALGKVVLHSRLYNRGMNSRLRLLTTLYSMGPGSKNPNTLGKECAVG